MQSPCTLLEIGSQNKRLASISNDHIYPSPILTPPTSNSSSPYSQYHSSFVLFSEHPTTQPLSLTSLFLSSFAPHQQYYCHSPQNPFDFLSVEPPISQSNLDSLSLANSYTTSLDHTALNESNPEPLSLISTLNHNGNNNFDGSNLINPIDQIDSVDSVDQIDQIDQTNLDYFGTSINGYHSFCQHSSYSGLTTNSFQNQKAYLSIGQSPTLTSITSVSASASSSSSVRVEATPTHTIPTKTRKSRFSSGEPNSRFFVCYTDGCGRVFKRSEHLKRHIRSIHTLERPYECPYDLCSKRFARSDNLSQHIRVHRTSKKALIRMQHTAVEHLP